MPLLYFAIHLGLDLVDQLTAQRFKFKIHTTLEWLHIATGHQGAVVTPDDAAQHVQGCMGPHELITPLPIKASVHRCAHGGQRASDGVPQLALLTCYLGDGEALHVGVYPTEILWLATATRIKGRAVQDDSAFGGISGDHRRIELLYIAISMTEQLSH